MNDDDMRFLSLNPRGKYVLKITLPDEKTSGIRVNQQMRTNDPVEARIRRDIALEFWIRGKNSLRTAKM